MLLAMVVLVRPLSRCRKMNVYAMSPSSFPEVLKGFVNPSLVHPHAPCKRAMAPATLPPVERSVLMMLYALRT